MGMFKLIWADNVPSVQIKLPDGVEIAYPYVPYIPSDPPPLSGAAIQAGLCTPPMTPTCRHEWKHVPGIYKVYSNCKHCGIGKETLSAENS